MTEENLGLAERVMDVIGTYADQLPSFVMGPETVKPVTLVVKRSLVATDPHGTFGISLDGWTPLDYEMIGRWEGEPTIQQYHYSLQHLIKWGNQEDGERIHREAAKAIRLMLYGNDAFQVSLRQLAVTDDVRKERVQRFQVLGQEFAGPASGANGTFWFMSATALTVETEVVSL